MPEIYTSIYETLPVISKKDMCALLNLDLARPNLLFSQAEINKAYRIRARQFHPDRQYLSAYPIPQATCTILMDDLARSHEHLLKGEDNIIGRSCSNNSNDWLPSLLATLDALKKGSSDAAKTIIWFSRFSRTIFMMIALSTFSDGQLNLRYVNQFAPILNAIRAKLSIVDSSLIVALLRMLQQLVNMDEFDEQNAFIAIHGLLPDGLITQEHLHVLLSAIKQAQAALKVELNDDLILHVEHILNFWPNFIAKIPSWSHLTAIALITLLTTATSVPKYFNAVSVLADVILQQKGAFALALSSPVLLLSMCLLPLNVLIQSAIQLSWFSMKFAFTVLSDVLVLIMLPYNMLFSEQSSAELLFGLLNVLVNLSVRLIVSGTLELVDSALFIITDTSFLSFWLEHFNHNLDTLLNKLKPVSSCMRQSTDSGSSDKGHQLIALKDNKASQIAVNEFEAPPVLPFFASVPLHNKQDDFLQNIFTCIAQLDRAAEVAPRV